MARADKGHKPAPAAPARRKQFLLDAALLAALEAFARDSGQTLDALAADALRDLLKKHGRPLSLRQALRDSTRELPANDAGETRPKLAPKRYRPKA